MFVLQNINEFNKTTNSIKNSFNGTELNHSANIVLTNKLKQINNQFQHVTSKELSDDFFSNIYHLLSNCVKEDLVESCLDVLISAINTEDSGIKERFLTDFRFLPVLITNILSCSEKNENTDDQLLVKLLTVIRELLSYSSEMNEHNLKLIVHSLRDYTINHKNPEVGKLCLSILVNLCLKNEAAKYLITRIIKQTELKEKIQKMSDDLIAFKYFVLLEDEIFSNDVRYFLGMSMKDVKSSAESFNLDAINHSLDVLEHIEQAEIKIDFKISDEEKLVSMLGDLVGDLEKLLSADDSHAKELFFSGIFNLFNVLLHIDSELVSALENFTEAAFLSTISKSASALKFLATYIMFNGRLSSSEIVVESLIEYFIGNQIENQQKIDYQQKYAFLCLLEPLQAKDKLSDVHLNLVAEYFDHLRENFKVATIAALRDEEVFMFIYFVFSLSSVAKINVTFYGKLLEVLKLDFLPVLIAKGHLSKKKEILEVLFKLSAVENFPNRKVSAILSRCGTRAEGLDRQNLLKPRRSTDAASKFIAGQLARDMETLIEKINEKLDNNDSKNITTTDMLQLYRHKIDFLNDHLSSVNETLDRSMTEIGELKQKIASFRSMTDKQEFINWCLQLDNERMTGEAKELSRVTVSLKVSIENFRKKLDTKENAIHHTEKTLQLKIKEIKEISNQKEQTEKKLEDYKTKLHIVQKENETRIIELKDSLEMERKQKSEELSTAIVEQTKLNQKLINSEKEKQNLQDLVKLHESQIVEKDKKIQQCEVELKEAEQMKTTIMSLMQGRSFKNK